MTYHVWQIPMPKKGESSSPDDGKYQIEFSVNNHIINSHFVRTAYDTKEEAHNAWFKLSGKKISIGDTRVVSTLTIPDKAVIKLLKSKTEEVYKIYIRYLDINFITCESLSYVINVTGADDLIRGQQKLIEAYNTFLFYYYDESRKHLFFDAKIEEEI